LPTRKTIENFTNQNLATKLLKRVFRRKKIFQTKSQHSALEINIFQKRKKTQNTKSLPKFVVFQNLSGMFEKKAAGNPNQTPATNQQKLVFQKKNLPFIQPCG